MTFNERFGPWAVVTGASSGIGQEMAEELLRRGLNVVLVARRVERLEAVAASLGVDATRVVPLDLSEPGAGARLARATAELEVGLLVHAAGFGLSGPHLDTELAEHLNMLDLNCRSVVELVHHFLPRLKARGRGGLCLFASIVGYQGVPWSAHYAATKAFVMTLGEALQIELAGTGVDVSVIAPGPTRTAFFERASMTAGNASSPRQVARAAVRRLRASGVVLPDFLGRMIRLALTTAPRWLRVRIMGFVMQGMATTA